MQMPFPYPLLNREQLIEQMSLFGDSGTPFLFVIDYKAEHGYVIRESELDNRFVRFDNSFDKINTQNTIKWKVKPITFEDYQEKFNYVQHQIHLGNSFLTNLTQPTRIETNLSLLELFNAGTARYKLWLNGFFTALSPESFVKITDGVISSFPMKGTIDATIPNAEEQILNNPKERAEHATIVDLIRNDLSQVASEVEVKRYRFVEKIKTNQVDLLQVSSEITGKLQANYASQLGVVFMKLLPAGSICGAPKAKTLEIIESAENYRRGFYTGVCGWFDGKNLDSAVLIRFIEQNETSLIFKSGGGITAQSNVKNEYEELIQKVYVPIC